MDLLLDRFAYFADQHSTELAFRFLKEAGGHDDVSFAELKCRVDDAATMIRAQFAPGERLLLLYPTCIDFPIAFLGCLTAGCVAVPLSLTGAKRRLSQLQRIITDCGATGILTTSTGSKQIPDDLLQMFEQNCVLYTDKTNSQTEHIRQRPLQPVASGSDLAVLQYTSGSTSLPKGVMLTHEAIAANLEQIRLALGHHQKSVMLSWLPLFHDMGLFGCLLSGLWVGFPVVLMPPTMFVREPLQWLRLVGKYCITTTGGPNFAFELCLNRISGDQKRELDLSSLECLWNGAEPIRSDILKAFALEFSECGLRESAIFPCYGLAEATLMVSGGFVSTETFVSLDGEKVARGIAANEICEASETYEVCSCGTPTQGTRVFIVDECGRRVDSADTIGEIAVQSPSLGVGYWNNSIATQETFRTDLTWTDKTTLMTGDLGFFRNGQLFVCGRRKDVIIQRGRNIYPQDIEALIAEHLGLSGANSVGAFGYDTGGVEQIGIVAEATRDLMRLAVSNPGLLSDRLRHLLDEVQLELDVIISHMILVRPASFPRTTSGKVQRSACRELWKTGQLDEVFSLSPGETSSLAQASCSGLPLRLWQLAVLCAPEGRLPEVPGHNDVRKPIRSLGMDSLAVQSYFAALEKEFCVSLSPDEFDASTTVVQLAEVILKRGGKHQTASSAGTGSEESSQLRRKEPHESNSDHCASNQICGPVNVDARETSLTDMRDVNSPDLFAKVERFRPWVTDLRHRGFQRYLLPVKHYRGGRALVGSHDSSRSDREVILYCSADYLDLAHEPSVIAAAQAALETYGASVSSVPLVAGLTDLHYQLEQELAAFLGTESCVLFPTGLSANTATIAALCNEQDFIVVDNQVHYSILEGVRLSGAGWRTFLHSDPDNLRSVLQSVRQQVRNRGVLVVLEGVYGIDGDSPQLEEILRTAREFDARVLLDDAHALGVSGRFGRGTAEARSCQPPDILMGSLSKSLGSFGGFIAGSERMTEYLRYFAKSIVFAVGLPTVNVAAALKALEIIRNEPQRIEALRRNSEGLRERFRHHGIPGPDRSNSTIMSCRIGDEGKLKDVVRDLFERGVWAEGLPFPAVSRGEERLRFRVRFSHTAEDLDLTANAVAEVLDRHHVLRNRIHGGPVVTGSAIHPDDGLYDDSSINAEDIVSLMIEAATLHGWALPWISRTFALKFVERRDYWKSVDSPCRWFTKRNADNKLTACVLASIDSIQEGHGQTLSGLIGNAFWLPGQESEMEDLITRAKRWLPSSLPLLAPAVFPVQIFGAGARTSGDHSDKPLLESTAESALLRLVEKLGLQGQRCHQYRKFQLHPVSGKSLLQDRAIHIRPFRREELAEEVRRILPLFNQTIGMLNHCSQVPEGLLQGLVSDLRDLIVPGYCWIAERQKNVVGFCFSFPNVTDAFRQVRGHADIADFEKIRNLMESIDTGFIAWLGVEPRLERSGLGPELIRVTLQEMRARNIKTVWTSWELVDEELEGTDFQELIGVNSSIQEYVFACKGS